MLAIATTKLSSKGQVVIPEEIREQLHLESGCQFVVYAQDDTVFLKLIAPPSKEDLKSIMAKAREAAKKAGLTKDDLENEIKLSRRARKRSQQ
ncbi:MAG: AbrB/MazE/SpoVT family DNA-binding domain-containing protein [Deltaproteobacteria bacterium]|nr:AbrB/MazE/SpoVT family DNA-binding domain-containing protein [Deltaproteobacteria bacterium]